MVATELNYQIRDLGSDCQVRLTSNVSNLVMDTIVEPIDEKVKKKVLEPNIFPKLLLDLLCSLLVHLKQQEYNYGKSAGYTNVVQQFFEQYIDDDEMQKEVSKRMIHKYQFEQALNANRVIGTQKEKIAVFYYVQHEAAPDAQKEDIMEINKMVNWLLFDNNYYQFTENNLWDEILLQIATNCSQLQLPIRDITERYEKSKGKILTSDFSFSLIEQDFQMKKLFTHNIIDLITLKYNTHRETLIEYEQFLQDLMAVQFNRTLKDKYGEA